MNTAAAKITLLTTVLLAAVLLGSGAANARSAGSEARPADQQPLPRIHRSVVPKPSSRLHSARVNPRPAQVKTLRAPFGGFAEENGEDEEETEGAATSASLTTPLYYRANGYVQPSPRIYIVYWGNWSGDSYGVMQRLYYFYLGIGGSSWNNTQTQYGMNCIVGTTTCTSSSTMIRNTTGQLKNWVQDTRLPPSKTPSEAEMAAEARWAASYFRDEGYEAQYIIALPPGYRDQKSIAKSWCAWHNYTTLNSGNAITYTSMPYLPNMGTTCGMNRVNAGSAGYLDGVSIYAGHEYAESETDPFLNAWGDASGDENADKCLQYNLGIGWFKNVSFTSGTFAVQPMWNSRSFATGGSACYFWL
jgi:hypothetical protein